MKHAYGRRDREHAHPTGSGRRSSGVAAGQVCERGRELVRADDFDVDLESAMASDELHQDQGPEHEPAAVRPELLDDAVACERDNRSRGMPAFSRRHAVRQRSTASSATVLVDGAMHSG